ncbi:MAG: DUF4249 domain-containing protein [Saprospiraceae bacterium]
MHLKYIILYLLFSLFLASSCTKELKIDLSNEQSKMVVNGLINNVEPLHVSLTESFVANEDLTIKELADAEVKVYSNGQFIEQLTYESDYWNSLGAFVASFKPIPNTAYQIEIEHPDFNKASAVAQVPTAVDLEQVEVSFGGGNNYPFSFEINPPVGKQYFYLKTYFNGFTIDSVTQEHVDQGAFIAEIPNGTLPRAERYIDNGYIFQYDVDGAQPIQITGVAKLGLPLFQGVNLTQEERAIRKEIQLDTTQLYIHLQTLTADAYRFYASNAKPIQQDADFFTESSSVYGNVENGLGIWAGIYVSEVAAEVN